jgi:hypothetical protein
VRGGDDGRVDAAEDLESLVKRRRHRGEQVAEAAVAAIEEVADVATHGQRRPIAADQDRADAAVGGDVSRHFQGFLRHAQVDGVARLGTIQAHRRHTVLDLVVDRLRRAGAVEGGVPCGGVGELDQRFDAPVGSEPDQVDERRLQRVAGPAGRAAIGADHHEAAVLEHLEVRGDRTGFEVLPDAPPEIGAHRLRADVPAPHVQRQALGGVADEVRVQQLGEGVTVSGDQRVVKALGRCGFRISRDVNRHSARSIR